jgi:hypothetical protein
LKKGEELIMFDKERKEVMFKSFIIFTICSYLFLCIVNSYAQSEPLDVKWNYDKTILFNGPDSPLELRINENRKYISLKNNEEKSASKVWFGCVEINEVDDSFMITRKYKAKIFKLNDTKIEPKETLYFGKELSGIEDCTNINQKMAVVKVIYNDGSFWQLHSTR